MFCYKKSSLMILLIASTFACSMIKAIPPEQQFRSAVMPTPMKKTYKLIRPCLIKNNYYIDKMDISAGTVKAISRRNRLKYLYVTVSHSGNTQSVVKLKLDVRKRSMTGEYKRIPVPPNIMQELDNILSDINQRASIMK